MAIRDRHTDIAFALIEKGANLDIQDNHGNTYLHKAIHSGSPRIALALIEKGANLNIKNKGDITPLHTSISKWRKDVAIALIHKGADVNIKTENGESTLDIAYKSDNPHSQQIINALIDNGAEVYNINKTTSLVISIITGIATISLLITAVLLPSLSTILFGCAVVIALSSIISLNYYFTAPELIAINNPVVQPLNKNETKECSMKPLGENGENNQELSSSQNNNLSQ